VYLTEGDNSIRVRILSCCRTTVVISVIGKLEISIHCDISLSVVTGLRVG